MDRITWLRERQKGVGSSDAPNLVGVGFGDARRVYKSKIEPPDGSEPKTGILARGIALEDTVARLYAETMGVELARPAAIITRAGVPWQFASLDRVRDDERPVECKTVAGFGDEWGENGSDRIPDGYTIQAQHQMGVIGADSIDVAALDVIAWELRCYRIPFNRALFSLLTDIEAEFWHCHVMQRTPPGPEWEEQFRERALARMERGKQVELPVGAIEMIDRRKELGAIRDEADGEYKRLGQLIEGLMGDAEIATAGPWKVKRVHVAGGEYTATRHPYSRLDIRAAKSPEKRR